MDAVSRAKLRAARYFALRFRWLDGVANDAKNLTPNPFPSRKGDRIYREGVVRTNAKRRARGLAAWLRALLVAIRPGYLPVPFSGIICGAPIASSLMINSPVWSPSSGGVKVTETSQVFPGANDLMH